MARKGSLDTLEASDGYLVQEFSRLDLEVWQQSSLPPITTEDLQRVTSNFSETVLTRVRKAAGKDLSTIYIYILIFL